MKEIALPRLIPDRSEGGLDHPTSAPLSTVSAAACTTTAAHTPTPSSMSSQDSGR